YRRADRGETFLAAVALDHRARRAVHDLRMMSCADQSHVVARDDGNAAGEIAQLLHGTGRGNDDFLDPIAGEGSTRQRQRDAREGEPHGGCKSVIVGTHDVLPWRNLHSGGSANATT